MIRVSGNSATNYSEFSSSVWRCEFCETVISLFSMHVVPYANCPTCNRRGLDYVSGDIEMSVDVTLLDA